MSNSFLQYPVTRPITLGICFNATIIILGIAWVALITTINIATVAYEIVPITSTQFNVSCTSWYEHFIPVSSWVSPTRICNGPLISLNEGVQQGCNANL
jgi:hypothetical protein